MATRFEVTVDGPIALSAQEALRVRFDQVVTRPGPRPVLVFGGDQAAVRAVLELLWDTGHDVRALNTVD